MAVGFLEGIPMKKTSEMEQLSPCILVIFGGTGDLTHRKLVPAMYNLAHQGQLPRQFALVSVGRQDKTTTGYLEELRSSVEKYSRRKIDTSVWDALAARIFYFRLDFGNGPGYLDLKAFLKNTGREQGTGGNYLYYLATAPGYFETITLNLKQSGMAPENGLSWQRLMIEKPFGKDLKTACYLNQVITGVFRDENIFRIDHYLGKEMLQNILIIRFGNAVFESIWNSRHIDNIQITSSETVGVESRAGFYNATGALRDMVQSHLLQLVALVAMEPPADLSAQAIRAEKVKLLRSLTRITPGNIAENVVRGQYAPDAAGKSKGYRQEDGIPPDSDTETFTALRLQVENFRWSGTPIYLRTGKKLPDKITRIIIEFKSLPNVLYFKEFKGMQPNILEISIHPDQGVSFRFNAQKPGSPNEITGVTMNFCHNCKDEDNTPEAYERLLADAIQNDQTRFTGWTEIEESWRFVDDITAAWEKEKPDFPNYRAGDWGPKKAGALIKKYGHKWWNG